MPLPAIAPPVSDGADAPDRLVAIAEAHLAMFTELRERGMQLTRMIVRRVEMDLQSAEKLIAHQEGKHLQAPRYLAPNHDAAQMFAKITRALRLTAALEMKTAEKLRALIDGVAVDHEARREEAAKRAKTAAEARNDAAKRTVCDLVLTAIEAEAKDKDEEGDLCEALEERLDDDEAYADIEDLPVRDVVEALCADLGIVPDWSRWTGEGWRIDPFPCRPKNSIFNTPSRKPLMEDLNPGTWTFAPDDS